MEDLTRLITVFLIATRLAACRKNRMYCAVPFNRMHIYVNGEATLCYGQTWTSRGVGNVLQSDILSLWDNEAAREIRESILDQSFRYCTDCRCPEMVEKRAPPTDIDLSTIGCLVLSYDYACNLSCPSCRTTNKKDSPLSAAIHAKVLESGILRHVKMISVMGSGEALASRYFWDLVIRLPSLDCHPDLSLSLTTNGVLLTPKNLERILTAGKPLKNVEVSIDAACKATYLINRRGGDWDVLMSNLAYLVREGIPLRVNFVVQANNFREMPAFVELAIRIGAEYVRFDGINNWGAFTPEEYKARAVHFPSHPEHFQLKEILAHPILRDKKVHMAQLSEEYFSTLSPLKTIHAVGSKPIKG
jgi:molybdenum cofactor biosynthesis enzyme MoaA